MSLPQPWLKVCFNRQKTVCNFVKNRSDVVRFLLSFLPEITHGRVALFREYHTFYVSLKHNDA